MLVHLVAALLAASAAEPPPSEAQVRYDAALDLLLEGRLADAALAFDGVATDPAAPPPLAERARALAEASRALDARGRFVPRLPAGAPPAGARLDQSGRGELALYATAFGIWTGLATGVVLDADDGRLFAALALAGGGGGLALATYGTRGRAVPDGRTQAIEAAGNWGSLNGGLVAGLLDGNGRAVAGTTLGVGLAGIGTAVALTSTHSPSSGDVAVANSGGLWGLAAGGLSIALMDSPSDKVVLGTLLAGTDVGLGAMSLASRRIEISRGRSLLIDAGGVVGTLVGLSIPLFASVENPRAYGVGGLLGLGAGITSAVYLTRGWDEDAGAVRSPQAGGAMPWVARREGGGVTVGLAGRF